ncbi:MAG: tetratricopeptide repeat protein [Ignavibacteria bacterium]|jgi:tetratricopeptide (TPR) repeat protein
MSEAEKTKNFTIDTLVIVAVLSVLAISSSSFAISRYVIEQQKPDKEETLRLANEAYDRGDFQNAAYLYQRYIDVFDNENISVRIDYGYSLHNVGNSAKGIEILQSVLQKQPRNAFALFNIAVIYFRDGNKVKAKEWMKQCIEKGDSPEIVEKATLLLQQM